MVLTRTNMLTYTCTHVLALNSYEKMSLEVKLYNGSTKIEFPKYSKMRISEPYFSFMQSGFILRNINL